MPTHHASSSYAEVRSALLKHKEIALLDVREEHPHAQAHPLFAANFPLSRIEVDAYTKLPRKSVPIVVLDAGEGYAERAADKLLELGYKQVSVLSGGISGWQAAGGELFRDVNVPSKAFGELVEAQRHTPSLSADEVQFLIERNADILIVDARRYDEYQTMSIPTATNVPGAELLLRISSLVTGPNTLVIVNCAGRTRSIIGTQSLVNACIPNPVAALRNGTIGWTLAGLNLDRNQSRRFGEVSSDNRKIASESARRVADCAGVQRINFDSLGNWFLRIDRSIYFFDVRTSEEYEAGHLPGFRHVAGGQLVQETEMVVPVRGARIVLADNDGVRANMSASWLAQMGWEVYVLDGATAEDFKETGNPKNLMPPPPAANSVSAQELEHLIKKEKSVAIIDLNSSINYHRGHIPGAWFALRSQLDDAISRIPAADHYVLTCANGLIASYAVAELSLCVGKPVYRLEGGNAAWEKAGFELEIGGGKQASPPIDRYRRPYEGTDNPREAMQGYLDWEFGLIEQLSRDGTHGFRVL